MMLESSIVMFYESSVILCREKKIVITHWHIKYIGILSISVVLNVGVPLWPTL